LIRQGQRNNDLSAAFNAKPNNKNSYVNMRHSVKNDRVSTPRECKSRIRNKTEKKCDMSLFNDISVNRIFRRPRDMKRHKKE